MARSIDYTNKDYESLRNNMLSLLSQKLPEYTDRSQSDPGIVLIELLAHGLDILSYYQDRQANELYLPTARTRKAIINLCKLIDYTLKPATPSKVMVRFMFSAHPNKPIPKGFQVGTQRTSTEESIIFEVENTTPVPMGQTVVDVVCVQGYSVNDEVLGSGTGEPNQTVTLSQKPVIIDDTLEIWIRDNLTWNKWTRVSDFINSGPNDLHYTVDVDENDVVTITFGNGVNGAVVPIGVSNIRANYRVGGGKIGNVGANTITQVISSGLPGIVSVTNPEEPFIKGEDKESIESARINAPKSYRMRNTLVTLQDFEDYVSLYPGVDKSQAILDDYGNVHIYVKPTNGEYPTQELKDSLLADMDSRRIFTVGVSIHDPSYDTIDMVVDLYVQSNYLASYVSNIVDNTIRNYFSGLGFKDPVVLGRLYRLVMSLDGVDNVVFKNEDGTPFTDIAVENGHIVVLGNLTINTYGGA